MRIAVTGSAGFIGAHLLPFLTERGHLISGIEAEDEGGILNLEHVKSAFGDCDVVIHLGAYVGARSKKTFQELYETNVIGSLNVVEAAKAANVPKIVYASSTAVRTLRSDYATTKAMAETLLRGRSRQLGLDFVGLRLFNVYGPGQSWRTGALIPTVIEDIRRGRPTTIHGNGLQTRDFVYISDAVSCLCQAAEYQDAFRGLCIDVGTGWASKVITVVRLINEIAGKQALFRFANVGFDDAARTWGCADTTLCLDRLGITQFIGLREGLDSTWTAAQAVKLSRAEREERKRASA